MLKIIILKYCNSNINFVKDPFNDTIISDLSDSMFLLTIIEIVQDDLSTQKKEA